MEKKFGVLVEWIRENLKAVVAGAAVIVACIVILAMCGSKKPYIGEWSTYESSLSDLTMDISITKDEITVNAYFDGHNERLSCPYEVSKDDRYTYLEATHSSGESFVLVLLDKNTLAICYAENDGYYTSRTPSGTRFNAECLTIAHKGNYKTEMPEKVNIKQLGDRLDWDNFSNVDVKYYKSSSLLYLDDGNESVLVYVKSNGNIVYIEGLAPEGLADYDDDVIFTDHPFVITDDK